VAGGGGGQPLLVPNESCLHEQHSQQCTEVSKPARVHYADSAADKADHVMLIHRGYTEVTTGGKIPLESHCTSIYTQT